MPILLQLAQSYSNPDSVNYKLAYLREQMEQQLLNLGDLAYEDQVQLAMLGETIIVGGYLRTELIAANSITADKINVASLSAISADLGTVTAGNISGVTITGATIRTSSSSNRVQLDGTDLKAYYNGIRRVQLDFDSLDFYDTEETLTAHVYAIPHVTPDGTKLPMLEVYSHGVTRVFSQQDNNKYAEITIWKPYLGTEVSHPGSVSIYTANNDAAYGGVTGYGKFEVSPGGAMMDVRKLDAYTDLNVYQGFYGSGNIHADGRVYATSFEQTSSESVKTDIRPLKINAYEQIENIDFYEYSYEKVNKRQIGLIAEKAPETILNDDKTGIDLYSYITLVAKAVQEIQKKLEGAVLK